MANVLEQVLMVLSTTAERWDGLAKSVPVDLLKRRPAAGEWSAVECLQHLINTEREVFPVRVRHFLHDEDLPNYNTDQQRVNPGDNHPVDLAQEFSKLRDGSLKLLETLKVADLSRQVRHEEMGPVTLEQMLNEWAGHDLMHTVQAERALMQPFILGCGPWKPYFSGHFA
jgi:hypothetical protein